MYVAPGNGGTALSHLLENIAITDVRALREWAQAEKIALTVVGPEAPLAAGVVDEFRAHGLRIFGPTKAAAQLESSKAFSKAFMRRHGIPTADYDTFTDPAAAHAYVERQGRAHRRQGRRPGCRQGRGRGHDAAGGPRRGRLHAGRQQVRRGAQRRRRACRHRRVPAKARRPASSCCATARTSPPWPPARTTSACRTATKARTPAAWARIRPRPWSRPTCTHAPCARSSCPPCAAWKRTAFRTPASCTPA